MPHHFSCSSSARIRRRQQSKAFILIASLALFASSVDYASAFLLTPYRRPTSRRTGLGRVSPWSAVSNNNERTTDQKISSPTFPKPTEALIASTEEVAKDSDTTPKPSSRTILNHQDQTQKRLGTVWASILLSLVLLFSPTAPAHAGFGPSSGATTSPPPGLRSPSVKNQDLIGGTKDNKKLKVLIGSSMDERRLQEFNLQLDDIIDSIRERSLTNSDSANGGEIGDEETTMKVTAANSEEELEKAELLQSQILDRQRLLSALEAQPYWFNYLAAFIGSLASTLIMHPVDTIKTRQQLNAASEAAAAAKHLEVMEKMGDHHEHHNATMDIISDKLVDLQDNPLLLAESNNNKNNLLGLYEGLTGNIWKEGPPSALYLGVYETVKSSLLKQVTNPKYLLFVYLISGAAGEMVGSVVRAPAEAVKSLVQSNAASSALEAAQNILGTPEGRQNVIRAWSASIGRDVPFGAIQLATFELVKAAILNNPNIDFDSSTLSSEAIIGAFAGACGAFITNPADVITTRIITQSTNSTDGGNYNETKPLGVIEMGQKIYREEGINAFFAGWTARVGYWAPAISIFLTCYCSVRQAGVRYDLFG